MAFVSLSRAACLAATLALIAPSVDMEATRGRVQIVQNGAWDYSTNSYDPGAPGRTVLTDQGTLLRGTNFWALTSHAWAVKYAQKRTSWELLANNGFNCVRLALNNFEPDILGDPLYFTDAQWLAQIDQWVDWADELGLYVILEHHQAGGHTQEWVREFWTAIAPRYRYRTHVIYEIANEPVAWRPMDYSPQDMADQQEIYDLIRSMAPKTHIVVLSFAVPDVGMNVVASELDVDWSNTSVGFHGYWMTTAQHINTLKRSYPVFNTEFCTPMSSAGGAQSPYYLDGYMWQPELMEKWKISYAVWDANYKDTSYASTMVPLLAHAQENGYAWEADDYQADGRVRTEAKGWVYMMHDGFAYSQTHGWMYYRRGDNGMWYYNYSDDTWHLVED